jgi:hypothetical protein
VADDLSVRYGNLLSGSYDCVDRIVLNAFFAFGCSPGGFRTWWRALHAGSDEHLDDAHLMRMAGRFGRRVRAWGQSAGVPVIYGKPGERKHLIAQERLAACPPSGPGVFLVLVAKAMAPVWKVKRSAGGIIVSLGRKTELVNHYSFHIMDPEWGHVTVKMAGHPPFGAQIMLNGHEYVAAAAAGLGVGFGKEGNCFTSVTDTQALARVADTLSAAGTAGRLARVCQRWICSSCLCFALDSSEQQASGFNYSYPVCQAEYSRNLIFRSGAVMDQVFSRIIDRTRARIDVPVLKTLFGAKRRPHRDRKDGPPRLAAVTETPVYDLTVFKLHFGKLTLKAYTKGEHVLRFEAIAHNTSELRTGRVLDRFCQILTALSGMLDRFLDVCDCVHAAFVSDQSLDQLPQAGYLGATRLGGIDINRPRARAALAAALALATCPAGFTAASFTAKVQAITGDPGYTARQGAYDIRKLRAKNLITRQGRSRRYTTPPEAARTIAGIVILRDQVLIPCLAGIHAAAPAPSPVNPAAADQHYHKLRSQMRELLHDCGLMAAQPQQIVDHVL